MYPFHYPSSSYAPYYLSPSSDSDYYRALAEERAAREQFVAAQRAQEEARQRAARARAARRAYAAPYSSFHDDEYSPLDLDMDLDGGAYYPQQRPLSASYQPYGFASPSQFSAGPYGTNPRQQRALMEEQRRREMLEEQQRREVLELERERRRQEEERLRRVLLEERQREEAERRRMLEEERARRVLEEEKLRRAIEEEKLRRAMLEEEAARRERERTPLRSQQDSLQSLLRALGFVPAGMDSDSEQERQSRDARNGRSMRAHTTSPNPRRASAAPRSPIRPTKSDQPSTSPTSSFADTLHAKPHSPTPDRVPVTTIPILSPKPTPTEVPAAEKQKQESALPPLANPTPEQVSAAAKIQEAYRAHSARTHALKSISTLRTRFLAAKAAFTLPSTLDYEGPFRTHVTVTLPTPSALPSPPLSTTGGEEEDPFAHVPKLAYTPNNAPLHAYEEELSRILSALDAVESRGDAGVRAARRELARMVEREAERVERWRGVVWEWWTGREKAQEPVGATEVPSTPVQPVEATQPEATPEEPAMQVEPPSEPEPVDAAPPAVAAESTSEAAPMEVEPALNAATPHIVISPKDQEHAPAPNPADTPTLNPHSSSATPLAPPTPEIDVPDADAEPEEAAPVVDIAVEPPSRAEPADPTEASESTSSEAPIAIAIVEEAEEAEELSTVVSERPSSPSLSDDLEMEVEPQEAHTPPPGAHTPLVVVDPPANVADLHELMQEGGQQQASAPKRGASPLVDRTWDEFRTYDMF